jgi:hypothetical protein
MTCFLSYTSAPFHKLHKSIGYPLVQDKVARCKRMGEFGKYWLKGGPRGGGRARELAWPLCWTLVSL